MGKRILIVDDSSFMRKRIREHLLETGHSVVGEAQGGKDAVEMFGRLEPDVVTMDITMRDMDGMSAAKEILEQHPDAKILFFTILDDERYEEEAMRLGAVGFLTKSGKRTLSDALDDMD